MDTTNKLDKRGSCRPAWHLIYIYIYILYGIIRIWYTGKHSENNTDIVFTWFYTTCTLDLVIPPSMYISNQGTFCSCDLFSSLPLVRHRCWKATSFASFPSSVFRAASRYLRTHWLRAQMHQCGCLKTPQVLPRFENPKLPSRKEKTHIATKPSLIFFERTAQIIAD